MAYRVILLSLLVTANGVPIQDMKEDTSTILIDGPEMTTAAVELGRNSLALSYIQNFKVAMAEYVISHYKNLTHQHLERVNAILEEFLTNFAKDLKETVEKHDAGDVEFKEEEINDGIPNETFDDIKKRIQFEFKDVKEETAKEIVYRLRKNLFETRHKIDQVINYE